METSQGPFFFGGTLLFPRPSVRNNRTPALEATRAAESAAGASVLTMDTVVGQLVAARIEAGRELLRDESFVDCPSALTNGRWHTHPVRAEPVLVPVEQLHDLYCSHAHVQRHRVRTGVMHLHLVARAGIARLTASALCRPVRSARARAQHARDAHPYAHHACCWLAEQPAPCVRLSLTLISPRLCRQWLSTRHQRSCSMTTTASTSAISRCGPAGVVVEATAAGSDGWWRRFGGLRGRMLYEKKVTSTGRGRGALV